MIGPRPPRPDERRIVSAAKRKNERLIVLLLAGGLALNYPLLSLASRPALVLGIPVLYLYLFIVWACFIGLVAMIVEHGRRTRAGNKNFTAADSD